MEYSNPIISKFNADDSITKMPVREYQVNPLNLTIQLEQIPSEYHRVLIDNMIEVYDIEDIKENNFKVNYNSGVIYFHPSKASQFVTVREYYGIGVELITAKRVATEVSPEGDVVKTLQDDIDTVRGKVQEYDTIYESYTTDTTNRVNTTINNKIAEVDTEMTGHRTTVNQLKTDYDNATHFTLVTSETGYYTALADNTVSFQLPVGMFNPLIDILFLNYQGFPLIVDDNYSITGGEVTLLGWTLKKDEKIYIKVEKGIKSVIPPGTDGGLIMNNSITEPKLSEDVANKLNRKLITNEYKFTATQDNTIMFMIDGTYYNPLQDDIELYYKGSRLYKNINYTQNGLEITIFPINTDEIITYRIIKSVTPQLPLQSDGTQLENGTVGLIKLTTDVQEKVNKVSGLETQLTEKAKQSDLEVVDNRVNNIIAQSGTSSTEVVDIRTGVDGTVYETAKQRVDTELKKKLSKAKLTNQLENANFSVAFNVNSGWQTTLATYVLDVVNKVLKLTPTARLGQVTQTQTLISGHKYYASAKVKATNANVKFNVYYNTGSLNLLDIPHSGSNNIERLSGVFTATASANVSFRVIDFRTSAWNEITIQEAILVDLTAIFGEGKEPLKADFEKLLTDNFPNGFFELNQDINTFLGNVFGNVQRASIATQAEKIVNKGLKVKFDKTTDKVSICYKISANKNGKVVISKTGNNSLMMLKQFEYITGLEFDYFESGGVAVGGSTDWISPICMQANQNGDGNTSYTTTGGNHLMNGSITAWTRNYDMFVDGVLVTDTTTILDCEEVIVKVRNQIVGFNTHSLGRVILNEYVTYSIKNGVVNVEVRLVPIEDITVFNYYGLMVTSPLATYFSSVQYVNSLNHEFNVTVADQTKTGALSEELLDTFILKGTDISLIGYVDSAFNLGMRENCNATDVCFGVNGIKLYSNLVMKSTIMSARKTYAWRGYYKLLGNG